jgi:FkbM family methyltransferase
LTAGCNGAGEIRTAQMRIIDSGRDAVHRAQLGLRWRAFRGATALVRTPVRFVVRESLFYPMRPLVAAIARRRGGDMGDAWRVLLRGSGNAFAYDLRGYGCKVVVRHGTVDVFLLWEIFGVPAYSVPEAVRDALARDGRPIRLVDLGANVGFAARFLSTQLPVDSIVAYEPVAANLAALSQNRDVETRTGSPTWEVVPAAATTRSEDVRFGHGHSTAGRIVTDARDAAVVPGRDVIPDLTDAVLLKMDIEGGEWPIIADERFAHTGVRALVMEFHPWGCPAPDPRAYACDLLQSAGFTVHEVTATSAGIGTLWAYRI